MQVFVRNGRKIVFDRTLTVERSRPTRRNGHKLVAATTTFQFDFDIPAKFARVEKTPYSSRIEVGWEFGMMRDFNKSRSWKDWRCQQYH